ncbi:MAG: MATE family efflux transporter [Deltaproteobacteria bacterium]|nr:MATE family efflux transporter [Candidatus Anaeroferrophillacea bacterium]
MLNQRLTAFIARPRRALFQLALPTVTAMAVQTTYNMVDTAYVGRLGTAALAALTFSFPLFFILVSINTGMGVGLNSLIARQLGAGRHQAAENSALHGVVIALGTATVLFAAGIGAARPLFLLLGAEGRILELGSAYMNIILAGNFFMFPAYALHSIFSGQGDTVTPMQVQIAGLLLNIALDPLFIFTFDLGVPGAALATVISQGAGLVLFALFLHRRSLLRLHPGSFRWHGKTVRELLTVGGPASLTMLLMAFYIMFLNRFMAHYSAAHVAAFGMSSRLESAVVMPLVALAIALLTLTGMFHGASEFTLMRRIIHFAMKINLAYAAAVGIIFFARPRFFLRTFTDNRELLDIAAAYLRVEVFTFPLMAINITANRALQGMGFGLPGIAINFVRVFIVAIPLAYAFVYILEFSYLSIAVAMIAGGIAADITAIGWLRATYRDIATGRSPAGGDIGRTNPAALGRRDSGAGSRNPEVGSQDSGSQDSGSREPEAGRKTV